MNKSGGLREMELWGRVHHAEGELEWTNCRLEKALDEIHALTDYCQFLLNQHDKLRMRVMILESQVDKLARVVRPGVD